jgi:hypothetical protein
VEAVDERRSGGVGQRLAHLPADLRRGLQRAADGLLGHVQHVGRHRLALERGSECDRRST